MNLKALKLGTFAKSASFFVLAYVVGFLTLFKIIDQPEMMSTIDSSAPSRGPVGFLVQFLIVTVVFLALLPLFKRKPIFLKGFFYLIIFTGTGLILEIFIGQPLGFIIALALIIILAIKPIIILHNILFIVAIVATSIILALSFDSISIAYILSALALYDLIAVYVTKHMVKMAKISASKGVYLGIILPEKSKNLIAQKTSIKLGKGNGFMFLGGGDIALPLMLSLSVAAVNLTNGLIVGLFSFLGLFLLHLIFTLRKNPKPMPGLPPLVFMTILGYLIVTVF
jgi:presenilin-like A22 family membrane protease